MRHTSLVHCKQRLWTRTIFGLDTFLSCTTPYPHSQYPVHESMKRVKVEIINMVKGR